MPGRAGARAGQQSSRATPDGYRATNSRRSGQVRSGQVRSGQVRSGQVRSGQKVSRRPRPVWWCQGKALSRSIPAKCKASQQGQQRGRHGKAAKNGEVTGLGRREKDRNSMKRMNFFHYIKVSSLCPQFVPTLSSVPYGLQTRMVAGFR